jgi:hypothetical protein
MIKLFTYLHRVYLAVTKVMKALKKSSGPKERALASTSRYSRRSSAGKAKNDVGSYKGLERSTLIGLLVACIIVLYLAQVSLKQQYLN